MKLLESTVLTTRLHKGTTYHATFLIGLLFIHLLGYYPLTCFGRRDLDLCVNRTHFAHGTKRFQRAMKISRAVEKGGLPPHKTLSADCLVQSRPPSSTKNSRGFRDPALSPRGGRLSLPTLYPLFSLPHRRSIPLTRFSLLGAVL